MWWRQRHRTAERAVAIGKGLDAGGGGGVGGRHPLSDIATMKLDRNRFFSFLLRPAKATFHSILSFSSLPVCVCIKKATSPGFVGGIMYK